MPRALFSDPDSDRSTAAPSSVRPSIRPASPGGTARGTVPGAQSHSRHGHARIAPSEHATGSDASQVEEEIARFVSRLPPSHGGPRPPEPPSPTASAGAALLHGHTPSDSYLGADVDLSLSLPPAAGAQRTGASFAARGGSGLPLIGEISPVGVAGGGLGRGGVSARPAGERGLGRGGVSAGPAGERGLGRGGVSAGPAGESTEAGGIAVAHRGFEAGTLGMPGVNSGEGWALERLRMEEGAVGQGKSVALRGEGGSGASEAQRRRDEGTVGSTFVSDAGHDGTEGQWGVGERCRRSGTRMAHP